MTGLSGCLLRASGSFEGVIVTNFPSLVLTNCLFIDYIRNSSKYVSRSVRLHHTQCKNICHTGNGAERKEAKDPRSVNTKIYCSSLLGTGCPIKKATQAFGSCSRTRVPILFKLTMNIVRKMAKIIVTKANSLDVLPHLECVLLRGLHFCCFHWTRRSLLKKFGWDHPKTRFDFVKCPEQMDKSLRTAVTSNHDRNRL